MSSNPIKRDFSTNQIKILKLLLEKEYLQNELQEALKTTAPNLHYHLSRLEEHNLIIKETLHKVGSAKINRISLNPTTRDYVQKLLGLKKKISKRSKGSTGPRNNGKLPNRAFKKLKNNYNRISLIIFTLSLAGIITLSVLFLIRVPAPINLTANADVFTQVSQTGIIETENIELTADADVFTQKRKTTNMNVYDGTGSTPFLRLGLYDSTYDTGGYLSEIFVRFSLPKIESISSMLLKFTYYSGYPIDTDDYYYINASLVSNDWVEGNSIWNERPEYLGTSTLVYLHNPDLENEVYLNITNLVDGITETTITIHLCPNDLSRIRFPAPFYSSESYGITPRLILDYSTRSQSIIPDGINLGLIGLLVIFGILCVAALTSIVYGPLKHKIRKMRSDRRNKIVPIVRQENQVPIVKEVISVQAKPLEMGKKIQYLCPHCGTANFKGWKFCASCGKRMRLEKVSIDNFEFLGGFIISLIGGLTSIALGFGIPFVYPEMVYYMEDFIMILQSIMIYGGIVSIVGSLLVLYKPKLGGTIVMAGGFIAGINIITILGAKSIFKKLKN